MFLQAPSFGDRWVWLQLDSLPCVAWCVYVCLRWCGVDVQDRDCHKASNQDHQDQDELKKCSDKPLLPSDVHIFPNYAGRLRQTFFNFYLFSVQHQLFWYVSPKKAASPVLVVLKNLQSLITIFFSLKSYIKFEILFIYFFNLIKLFLQAKFFFFKARNLLIIRFQRSVSRT